MGTLGNITFYAENPLRRQLLEAALTEDDLARRALAEDPDRLVALGDEAVRCNRSQPVIRL